MVSIVIWMSVAPGFTQPLRLPLDPRKALGKAIESVNLNGFKRGTRNLNDVTWSQGEISITFSLGRSEIIRSILVRESSRKSPFESDYAFLDYAQAFLRQSGVWNRRIKFRAQAARHGIQKSWVVDGVSGLSPRVVVTLQRFKNDLHILFEDKGHSTRVVGTGNLMAEGSRKAFDQPKEFAASGCHLLRSPPRRCLPAKRQTTVHSCQLT